MNLPVCRASGLNGSRPEIDQSVSLNSEVCLQSCITSVISSPGLLTHLFRRPKHLFRATPFQEVQVKF